MLQYHLPSGAVKLSSVFELIENHLEDLEIEDFSVSQTTLDNVRLRLG
jgi:predicted DNA-binding protein